MLTVFFICFFLGSGTGEAGSEQSYIIKTNELRALQHMYSFTVLEEIEGQSLFKISATEDTFEQLKQEDEVEFIEPNAPMAILESESMNGQPSQDATKNWGYEAMNFPSVVNGKKQVKIAVLDTGVDMNHKDLMPYLEKGYNVFTEEHQAIDDHGHGTHVTGIITKDAPESIRIIPIKMLNRLGYGDVYSFIEAIYYAIEQDVDVINISLGVQSDIQAMEEAVDAANEKGIVIVAATGNRGREGVYYPAKYEEVIAVGAYDWKKEMAPLTQYGRELDFLAPGVDIWSTYLDGNYHWMSGTSMASGFVTRAAAFLMTATGKMDRNHLYELMERTSIPITTTGFKGIDVSASKSFDAEIDELIFKNSSQSLQLVTDSKKSWKIRFNMKVKEESVTERTIYIVNQQGLLQKNNVYVKSERNVVEIKPHLSYSHGQMYYLFITDDVKSEGGKGLKENVAHSWLMSS